MLLYMITYSSKYSNWDTAQDSCYSLACEQPLNSGYIYGMLCFDYFLLESFGIFDKVREGSSWWPTKKYKNSEFHCRQEPIFGFLQSGRRRWHTNVGILEQQTMMSATSPWMKAMTTVRKSVAILSFNSIPLRMLWWVSELFYLHPLCTDTAHPNASCGCPCASSRGWACQRLQDEGYQWNEGPAYIGGKQTKTIWKCKACDVYFCLLSSN